MAHYMEDDDVTKVTQFIKEKFSNEIQLDLSMESERLARLKELARKEHTEESYKACSRVAYGIEMYLRALGAVYGISVYMMHRLVRYYQFEVPARIMGKA